MDNASRFHSGFVVWYLGDMEFDKMSTIIWTVVAIVALVVIGAICVLEDLKRELRNDISKW